jgi:hypothetical protein
MQHRLIAAILFFLFLFSFSASGQKLINSPYSRFNIGTLENSGVFRSMGMGGVETSLRGNRSIHYSNPASYSSIDTNSFIFDFGLDYGRNMLSDDTESQTSQDMNFNHLIFGFPLVKGWGVAAGVVPMSSGYYQIAETVLETDPGFDPLVGQYISKHTGSGGFSNVFVGTGINLNKNISVGVNMRFLFGQVSRINQVIFDDEYSYHNNELEKLRLGGLNLDYGIQYTRSLSDGYFLNAGASYNSSKYFNTKYEHFSSRSTSNGIIDTISYISDDASSTFIPGTFRFGISYGKENKFTTGIDYVSTNWSNSTIPGSAGYAADTRTLHFGTEFTPDRFSNYNYFKRLDYRLGAHIGNNYLIINGEQLKEIGASAGLGIPMRRSLSKINLFIDYTRRAGSESAILHTENYFNMGVSLNFYDFWFVQRKYD